MQGPQERSMKSGHGTQPSCRQTPRRKGVSICFGFADGTFLGGMALFSDNVHPDGSKKLGHARDFACAEYGASNSEYVQLPRSFRRPPETVAETWIFATLSKGAN
jgi:hypothetical protein